MELYSLKTPVTENQETMRFFFMTFFIMLGLSACSSTPPQPEPINRVPKIALTQIPEAEIEAQLLLTARSIEQSLNTLIQQQSLPEAPPALNTSLLITPEGGMGDPVVIDWSGPIEGLIETIAERTHYEFKTLGRPPSIPILVSITSKNKLIADIIKDVGLQMGTRGDLVLYPRNKVIELRYASL
jgi:defect in organelle trafficking protein DotD